MRAMLTVALATSLMIGTTGCARVVQGAFEAAPALLPISAEQEVALGRQAAQQLVQEVPLLQNQAVQNYVQTLGQSLVRHGERKDIPYTFGVLASETPNALALPGGYVFVTSGLLKTLDDEAQLAGVIAHEIGHVDARHSIELIRQEAIARGIQVAAIGRDPGLTQLLGNVVRTLVVRGYGRAKELEADRLGAVYASRDGYPPLALGNALLAIEQRSAGGGGGGEMPSILQPFSTHPEVEQRINLLSEFVNQNNLSGTQQNRERYQQIVGQL